MRLCRVGADEKRAICRQSPRDPDGAGGRRHRRRLDCGGSGAAQPAAGEELALLDGVIADAGGNSAAKEAALAQKTQIAERMEREAQMTAILEGMGAEGALAVCGAQGVTLLVPQTFGMDENARNRLLNAVGGQSGSETAQLKIILIKK